tara:strand:- start:1811 stop:2008 length:198 start_codon:yes stop_codon:yes gene_type:complete
MVNNDSIKVGSLVIDANPYKAPEILYGYGVVVEILDERYVIVHWMKYDVIQNVRIEDLEVASESG